MLGTFSATSEARSTQVRHTYNSQADKPSVDFRAGQYLTFRIAREDCAMEARCVRGILPWSELAIRQHPQSAGAQAFLLGFASLRGQIFPVIDLGRKLGFAPASQGRTPCVIVIEIPGANGPQLAGFVADVVSEVVDVRGHNFRQGRIHGGGRPRLVIHADALLAPESVPTPR